MNTQEVIELLNLQEIQAKQEVIKKFQVDKATVIRVHTNDKYDLSNGMVNIQPMDTSKKFSAGDSVFLQIPLGDKQQTKIVARSNIKIPDEELYEYGEEPVTGNIYLACPDESAIKIYSLDGTAGMDISPGPNSLYNICSLGDYLYCSFYLGYSMFKVKKDGTDYSEIISQPWYVSVYGLAVDPTSTYLYIATDSHIVRIQISGETVEDTWKDFNAGFDGTLNVTDMCGNSSYLFVAGNVYTGGGQVVIRIFNYSGVFIREITFSDSDTYKITADSSNIYLSSSSSVHIYTIEGTFIRSIEGVL